MIIMLLFIENISDLKTWLYLKLSNALIFLDIYLSLSTFSYEGIFILAGIH